MIKSNYHTHSYFCDGNSSPEAYIEEAINKGFTHIGFSGHSPLPFENTFAIRAEQMEEYVALIRRLQQSYAGQVNIALGLEADYIPGISEDISALKQQYGLDYIIGSVHLVAAAGTQQLWFTDGSKTETYDEGLKEVFGNDIKAAVKAFYEQTNSMITRQRPDIIGHLDKVKMNNKGRYFTEEDAWYNQLVMETLQLVKESGCICEINTRGIYKQRYADYFPGLYLWKKMAELQLPVMVNSDAHKPGEFGLLIDEALVLAKEQGIKEVWYFDKGWKSHSI